MSPVLAALLIGLFLGSCLTAGAFLLWAFPSWDWRVVEEIEDPSDRAGA